jgi:hypothetical protein
MLRRARGEPAETALEANYQLGLRLRDAIYAKYPPSPARPAKVKSATKLTRAIKGFVGVAVAGVVGWAASSYFGSAAIYYSVLGVAVLVVYAHHESKIEDLKMEIDVLNAVLNERINELAAIAKAPERQALIDDFEKSRSAPYR